MTRSLGIHIGVQSIKIVELQFQGKGCIAHGVYLSLIHI